MQTEFKYKGFLGSAEVDVENHVLVGRLLFIRDVIAYSADTAEGLEQAFHEAVDDYLISCAEDGVEPDVPCKGSFNVRIGAKRHRDAALHARRRDMGLNDFVIQAIDSALAPAREVHQHYIVQVQESQEFTVTASDSPWVRSETVYGRA